MQKHYQYTSDGFYAGEGRDFGLLPNNSTRQAPPEIPEGFTSRWNGSVWELVENHKDKEGYLNGRPHTIKEFGPLPEGWSEEPPEPSEAELQEQEIAEIKARLHEIDLAAIRPLRAVAAGTDTDEDRQMLASYEATAANLRLKLAELG